MIFSYKTGHYW